MGIAAIATVLRDADENSKCIIFVDTKLEASDIAYNSLFQSFGKIAPLHGDISQPERARTLADFKSGSIKTLVATDVAARGLDIPGVDIVINMRPTSPEPYIHRSGRGGSGGKSEARSFDAIKRSIGTPFEPYGVAGARNEKISNEILEKIRMLQSSVKDYEELAEKAIEEFGAKNALASAFCILDGAKTSYSMITSEINLQTVQLSSTRRIISESDIRQILSKISITPSHFELAYDSSLYLDLQPSDVRIFQKELAATYPEIDLELVQLPPKLENNISQGRSRREQGGRRGSNGRGDRFDRRGSNRGDRFDRRDRGDSRGGRGFDRGNRRTFGNTRKNNNFENQDRRPSNNYGKSNENSFNNRGGEKGGNKPNFDFLFD